MQATLLRVLGTLALAVASPLLLLAALEGVAWALGVEPLADSPNRARRDEIRSCRWNPEHVEQCADPRLGRRRAGRRLVFVIGGSSVVGHPAGETRNIPHYLHERLERERRGRFAVRSLARTCKDSIYVEACALHLLDRC